MTIAIYGTGFQADRFFDKIQIYSNVNIVYFIQTDPDKESYRGIKVICADEINCRDFDYLVVAVSDRLAHDEIMNKLRSLKVPDLDLKIKQVLDFFHVDGLKLGLTMPYKSVKTEDGLVFLSEQKDITIPEHMWYYGTVWSKSEMDLFLDLTNRFYGKISHEKWFLDIGANIGTTSIYIRKQGYRVIGFEAGFVNHRLFKTNTILNDMDDIRTEYIALSDHSGDAYYYFNETNSGGSAVTDQKISSEKVHLLTLDEYLDSNGIRYEDIGFFVD